MADGLGKGAGLTLFAMCFRVIKVQEGRKDLLQDVKLDRVNL